jgi:hypothetical protein
MWCQDVLQNGAMQGIPLFWPFATMLCKERLMMLDQQVPQCCPFQNVKSVFTLRANHDKDHDKMLNRTSFGASDDLVSAFERNSAIPGNVTELPGAAPAGLDLNRDMLAILV